MDSFLPRTLNAPHITAFEKVLAQRYANIDISPCMMYMVDTCSPMALPFLADQFDVAQYRNYQLAPDDDTRRAIIKDAINTREYMGTAYMVKQAMIAVGFDPDTLIERCNVATDPVHGWAQFRVDIDISAWPVDGVPGLDLVNLISQYKNVRSQFMGIQYSITGFDDTFPDGDETTGIEVSFEPISDSFDCHGFKYNGAHKYDGSMKYRPGVESFGVTIVP